MEINSFVQMFNNPLIELLKRCDDSYTNSDEYYVFTEEDKDLIKDIAGCENATISTDDIYDRIYSYTKDRYGTDSYFQTVGAPVSIEVAKRGGKVPLPYKMGSMTEAHLGDLENWIQPMSEYTISAKLDGCLEANTMVITDKGEISIEEICKDISKYKVLSVDINGQEEFKEIENYLIRDSNEDTEWYLVTLEDGREILITGNHPVYLPKYNVYREVKDLIKGDYVLVKN